MKSFHVMGGMLIFPQNQFLQCLKQHKLKELPLGSVMFILSYQMTLATNALSELFIDRLCTSATHTAHIYLCLHSFRPRLIDMGRVYRQTNLENLEQAFNVAEKELGVTRLLDPEGTA